MSNMDRVRETAEKLRTAMIDNDPETIRALVDEDYEGRDASGRPHGRDVMIELFKPGGIELTAYTVSDYRIMDLSDTALFLGIGEISGRYEGNAFQHKVSYLDVYVKRSGGWRLIASQTTDLKA